MTDADRSYGSWPGYAAAVWALVFGLMHLVWAAGWYVGLEAEFARQAFARPGFLAYDLAVAGACLFGGVVALALVRPWGRRLPRWVVGVPAWAGTGLLVVRSVGSIAQVLSLVVRGSFVPRPMDLWELWFYVGALLFARSTWRFWTARPTSSQATYTARYRPRAKT